jgi:ATP-dependent DNA helicase DinG
MEEFFAPGGAISRAFDGYEPREQQVEMARAVQRTFAAKRHLVVEAGTGVGKSLAYLVPAIERACSTASRILISTFTIALQEQLINKDIPCLGEGMPWKFKAVLAKGRANYLCKRRLEFAMRRQTGLFDQFSAALSEISNWATQTTDGSLSDLPFIPEAHVWDAVKSENGNCRGRRCGHFSSCFCQRARRELENANVIVTNHALLFSDLALREEDASILPEYKWVIIDEAHNIERVAEEHFGIDISNGSLKFLLDGLYNPRTHKGLLVYTEGGKLTDLAVKAGEAAKEFFKRVRQWYKQNIEQSPSTGSGRGNGSGSTLRQSSVQASSPPRAKSRGCYKNFVEDNVSGHFKELRLGLSQLAKQAKDEDERFELMRYVDKCTALLQDLEGFLLQTKLDYVYWVEVDETGRETIRLKSAPLNVGPEVKRCLFDKFESVIMTSATLSSGEGRGQKTEYRRQKTEGGGFGFFAGRVGLEDFDGLCLGSPFDYQKQVTLYIERDLPEPNSEDFVERACEAVKKYILQTQGRAFVLFTSYQMLENFARQLAEWFDENDIELLQQGVGLDRTSLLKKFKRNGRFVLFGTDSFWQGVDVAGEALSNVIIVRLPFAVPDTPLLAGRLDKIREEGGNPFLEYQLPLAIIKFKQGFGRLIRTKTDSGIIVILDSRILSKSYGEKFLAAIPKCRTEIVE